MRNPQTGVLIDPNQIGDGPLSEEQLVYKENILDHYKHPRNKKMLKDAQAHARNVNPLCGDVIEVFIKMHDDCIQQISFQGTGCAISQASMSMLTEELHNKRTEEVLTMSRDDMLSLLNIPIGPVRMKCAMLGLRTVQLAITEGKI